MPSDPPSSSMLCTPLPNLELAPPPPPPFTNPRSAPGSGCFLSQEWGLTSLMSSKCLKYDHCVIIRDYKCRYFCSRRLCTYHKPYSPSTGFVGLRWFARSKLHYYGTWYLFNSRHQELLLPPQLMGDLCPVCKAVACTQALMTAV